MAEEFVSKDQFEEFTKRMEQGFEHMNRRFDQLSAEMRANNANIQTQMNQMRNWFIGLYGIVVFGFIGSIFITIIKNTLP